MKRRPQLTIYIPDARQEATVPDLISRCSLSSEAKHCWHIPSRSRLITLLTSLPSLPRRRRSLHCAAQISQPSHTSARRPISESDYNGCWLRQSHSPNASTCASAPPQSSIRLPDQTL